MGLALRNLLHEKTRFALSVAGVGLAAMLILLLNGFQAGLYRQLGAYLDNSPGSVVVAQRGVTGFIGGMSVLTPGTVAAVGEVPGVAAAVPIVLRTAVLELHDRRVFSYLVGYDAAVGGGPWRIPQGREPARDDEAVIDRVLAQRHGLGLGDSLAALGGRFSIVGLSDGTAGYMAGYVFITKRAAEALVGAPGGASFVLVTPRAGTAPDALRDRLDAALAEPGAGAAAGQALLKSELAANDIRLVARVFGAAIKLMSGVAFAVGALVVGLAIFTATVERQREYGVLKAVGAGSGRLYRVVAVQALAAAGAGSAVGLVLLFGARGLLEAVRPQFLIVVEPRDVAVAVAVAAAMALLGALAPARALAGLAPADVFRC